MPLPNEPRVGGHAMTVAGYSDDPAAPGGGRFLVRNSWGTRWATASALGAGYGTIPYAYLAQFTKEAYHFVRIKTYLADVPLPVQSLEKLSTLDPTSLRDLAAYLSAAGATAESFISSVELDRLRAFFEARLSAQDKEWLSSPMPDYPLGARVDRDARPPPQA